jgi:putative protease
VVEPGFEVSKQRKGKAVMTTKFCLLHENGMCLKGKCGSKRAGSDLGKGEAWKLPLHLDTGKEQFLLKFDCKNCQMIIESE